MRRRGTRRLLAGPKRVPGIRIQALQLSHRDAPQAAVRGLSAPSQVLRVGYKFLEGNPISDTPRRRARVTQSMTENPRTSGYTTCYPEGICSNVQCFSPVRGDSSLTLSKFTPFPVGPEQTRRGLGCSVYPQVTR